MDYRQIKHRSSYHKLRTSGTLLRSLKLPRGIKKIKYGFLLVSISTVGLDFEWSLYTWRYWGKKKWGEQLMIPLHCATKQIIKLLVCLLIQFGGFGSPPMNKNITNTNNNYNGIGNNKCFCTMPWRTLCLPVMSQKIMEEPNCLEIPTNNQTPNTHKLQLLLNINIYCLSKRFTKVPSRKSMRAFALY